MRYALAFLTLPLAACEPEYAVDGRDGDVTAVHTLVDLRASFDGATDDQLTRALAVADGTFVNRLVETAQRADLDYRLTNAMPNHGPVDLQVREGECPSLVVWGHLGWYHGGNCQSIAARRYDGELFAVNALHMGLDAYTDGAAGNFQPNEPAQLIFVDWTVDSVIGDGAVMDGTLRWTQADELGDYRAEYDVRIDEDLASGDRAAMLRAEMECRHVKASATVCEYLDGSEGWVKGLGSFEISGLRREEDGNVYGRIELRGESTVRFDMDAALFGCVAYEVVGGDSGVVCP